MNLTLAITNIGDLLLNNKISSNQEGDEIPDINLQIPVYQRPYKWTGKNVSQLLDDIIEACNSNKEYYRVGTLILHRDESGYNIVDGQQRTLTFALMLRALNKDLHIRFVQEGQVFDNPYNLENIRTNFRVLRRRIDSISEDKERSELQKYILGQCELIVVITDDLSEAFQFFDSQNARGKKLYPHDLLKAYHLREMNDLSVEVTEKTVKQWEKMDQEKLSRLFSEYLYRLKEWIKGNRAEELTEHNISKFKGITRNDNFPYAQFFKGAFAYADTVNVSRMPFVSGMRNFNPFQIDSPIIAGKPFFDYAKHYFDILADIQNNDKYSGYFINDNEIVKTLDAYYANGVGNRVTRLLFDTAILLYVDRFCPERPSKLDLEMLDRFVILAFVWAYSLRAQYQNLGWQSAQNFIMETEKINAFNLYKTIAESDSPMALFGSLADKIAPLHEENIKQNGDGEKNHKSNRNAEDEHKIKCNFLYYFKKFNFLIEENAK